MITSQQVRIILDRNRNGLDGRPSVAAGTMAQPGLYWDAAARKVVPIEAPTTVDRDLVLLARRLDVTVDELVRQLAMGGGGESGRAIPYEAAPELGRAH
ncbi:MAG TPA: hypothetical protein VFC93_11540 [Chloroflexota bacterium]|nr:hypothetical protein [Chloroflexota bacterium]